MAHYRLIPVESAEEIAQYKATIVGLWKKNLPSLSSDCFEWIYHDNPAGPPQTVLAQCVETQEYVGCAAICPRSVYVLGRKLKAGILINFALDAKHRIFGPAVTMQRELLSRHLTRTFDFIYGYPNKASEGVFKRAGYEVAGYGYNLAKVLKWESKLIKVLKAGWLAQLAGGLLDYSARLTESLCSLKDVWQRPGDRISFERLWERGCKNSLVLGARDEQFLRWRYRQGGYVSAVFFTVPDGYIVYRVDDEAVTLYDLFTANANAANRLVRSFVKEMRKKKFRLIIAVYAGHKAMRRVLGKLLFMCRPDSRPVIMAMGNNLTTAEKQCLFDLNNWHVFDGELDL